MTKLHADLEALMPEPFGEIVNKYGDPHAFAERDVRYFGDMQKQAIGTAIFTADQVREAMQAVAKLERQAVHAALRHEGLMLVRTQHGLRVMKAITDAEAEAASIGETK